MCINGSEMLALHADGLRHCASISFIWHGIGSWESAKHDYIQLGLSENCVSEGHFVVYRMMTERERDRKRERERERERERKR